MPSKAFNDFHASCFGNSVYAVRDGLDIRALLALEGTERAEAARLVLKAIPTSGDDTRAGMAAAYLGLPEATRQSLRGRLLEKLAATRSPEVAVVAGLLQLPEAAPLIRQIMATAKDGPPKVKCALALYQIDGDPEARAVCLKVLRSDLHPGQRLCALEALLQMTLEPGSTAALLDTVERDPDPYTRERALAVLAELFHEDNTITSIHAAHKWPYDWPLGSQWSPPPAETMSALRAAVARALAAS
jgi:hypothetical protein